MREVESLDTASSFKITFRNVFRTSPLVGIKEEKYLQKS